MKRLTCRRVRTLADQFIAGECTAVRTAEIECHALGCPRCRKQLALRRSMLEVGSRARSAPVPPSETSWKDLAYLLRASGAANRSRPVRHRAALAFAGIALLLLIRGNSTHLAPAPTAIAPSPQPQTEVATVELGSRAAHTVIRTVEAHASTVVTATRQPAFAVRPRLHGNHTGQRPPTQLAANWSAPEPAGSELPPTVPVSTGVNVDGIGHDDTGVRQRYVIGAVADASQQRYVLPTIDLNEPPVRTAALTGGEMENQVW